MPGVAVQSSYPVELGERVFLIATTHTPFWDITLRSGSIESMPETATSCIAEGATVEGVVAEKETAVIFARTSGTDPLRAAAFRLDAGGLVEPIRTAE